MGRAEEAKVVYETALTFDRQNPDLHYNIGVVHIELGMVEQAQQDFTRALQVTNLIWQGNFWLMLAIFKTAFTSIHPAPIHPLFFQMVLYQINSTTYFILSQIYSALVFDCKCSKFTAIFNLHYSIDFWSQMFNFSCFYVISYPNLYLDVYVYLYVLVCMIILLILLFSHHF